MMRLYCRLGNSDRTGVVPFSTTESTGQLKQRIGKKFHHDDDGCGTLKILTANKEEFEVDDSDLIRGEDMIVYYPSSKGNNSNKIEPGNRMLSVASLGFAEAGNDESSSDDGDDAEEFEMYPPTDRSMEADDDESRDDNENEYLPTDQSMEFDGDKEDTKKQNAKENVKRGAVAASPASRATKKQKRGGTCSWNKKGSETMLQNVEDDDKGNRTAHRATRETFTKRQKMMYKKASLLLNHISNWKVLARLAFWIDTVHSQNRSGSLTVQKHECLDRIGFFQESFLTQSVSSDRPLVPGIPEHFPNDEGWNRSFKLLQEIGKILGNYNVRRMYNWFYHKTKKFEKISGCMNEHEKSDYERFQALGIHPDVTQEMAMKGSEKHDNDKVRVKDDLETESVYEKAALLSNHISSWNTLSHLACWIEYQHRSGKLTVEKRGCLDQIGFFQDSFLTQSVSSDRPLVAGIQENNQNDENWNQSFKLLQEIGKVLGNYGVRRMYWWAVRKRRMFQEISGRMNETEKSDYERFQALEVFLDKKDDALTESMYEKAALLSNHISSWNTLSHLASWIEYQRRSPGRLTVAKRECLDQIGFFRDSFSIQFVPSDRPLIPGIQENNEKDENWNRAFKSLQVIGKVLGNYGLRRMYWWAIRKRRMFQEMSAGRMNETEKSDYERFRAVGIFGEGLDGTGE